MTKKSKGLIIIISLLVFLLILGIYFIIYKNKTFSFYAKVKESSSTSSFIEPLSSEKISADYPLLQIDIGNLNEGDLIKVSCDKEIIETYPPVARCKDYEFIINNSSKSSNTTTEEISTTTKYENENVNDNKTTTTKKNTTITTTKTNLSNKDEIVLNSLQTELSDVQNNQENKKFSEKAKEYFTSAIDFIFYDKDINGVYFKDLTSSAKLKVIALTLKLDNLIDNNFPDLKENLSSSYQNVKGKLVALYLDKTSEYCANNDKVCTQAQSDFQELKSSLNITWDLIKGVSNVGISKLKEWYEIYSSK